MCQNSAVSLGVPMGVVVHPGNSLLPLWLLLFPWETGTCTLQSLVIAPSEQGEKQQKETKLMS